MGRKNKATRAIVSDAGRAFAAGIFAVPERTAQAREPWKIPCIFLTRDAKGNVLTGCEETFDPKGVGAAWHTTCGDGRLTAKAGKAAEDNGTPRATIRETVLAKIAEARQ